MEKTLFGLQGAQLLVTCTNVNIRPFEQKGKEKEAAKSAAGQETIEDPK